MTGELIKLITENKSLTEISEITKLSRKQLFIKMSMLRQSGYLIGKQYNYNGEINYSLTNPFKHNDDNKLMIKADDDIKSIRMLLTSDSHYGHINQNLECTDKMFDYCVKENINLIFHLGDFFEGVLPNRHKVQKYNNVQEQIQETLLNYPYVPNILTITCLGNHDASFWIDAGIDIKTILENRRHDIIPVGYEQGIVKINNYRFILRHPIERVNIDTKYECNGVILCGHAHKFDLSSQSKGVCLRINVPSSSNIIQYNKEYMNNAIPSIIDAEFKVNPSTNRMVQGVFKQYILLNNQLILIGEQHVSLDLAAEKSIITKDEIKNPNLYTCFDIIEKKKQEEVISDSNVQNDENENEFEETKPKVLAKIPTNYHGMSQIEKFNARYNQ